MPRDPNQKLVQVVRKAKARAPEPPRAFPVTDPDLDAPDGAVVDGHERVGDRWVPRPAKARPRKPTAPSPAAHLDFLATPEPAVEVLTPTAPVDATRNPVLVYLATLDSEASRRVMLGGLKRILLALGSPADPEEFPWAKMRYAEVVAARAALMRPATSRGKGLSRAAPHVPAANTVNTSMCALRGVLRAAFRLGLMSGEDWARVDDVDGVKAVRLPAGRYIPEEEMCALFGACGKRASNGKAQRKQRGCSTAERDRAILATLLVTGIRRAELCGIQLKNVNRKTGETNVTGKGNKQRLVYLGDALHDVETWLKVRGEDPGPLFCAQACDGGWKRQANPTRRAYRTAGLSEEGLYGILKRIAAAAGVKRLSPHDFRRTCATKLLELGVDAGTVQKLLGHASVATTMLYDKRGEDAKKEAASLLKVPR